MDFVAKKPQMRNFLIKKFIKNPDNVEDPAVRESYGKLAGAVGIASNSLLCAIKILAGLLFGSIAILADGINNLSDASASLFTLIGFKLSGKAPDKDHPYGHGRTEYLAGLAVSVMVLFIGLQLLKSSFEKTLHPDPPVFSWLSVAIMMAAILIKLWQAGFNRAIGKRIASKALAATAADSRNDVITGGAVLLSTLVYKFFGLDLDGPAGILVAVFIIISGISLIKDSLGPILGNAPDPELVEALEKELLCDPRVLGHHDLIIHDYGPGRLFASVHAEVDANADMMETHDLIDRIEQNIFRKHRVLMTIHMDPLDPNDPLIIKLHSQLEEIAKDLSYVQSFHDIRVISGPTRTNVVFDVVVDPDCKLNATEISDLFTQRLKHYDENYKAVITVDRSYS